MTIRFTSAALLFALASSALAQSPAPETPPQSAAVPQAPAGPSAAPAPATPAPIPTAEAPRPATVKVSMVTSEGPILLELEKERAPITTNNFLRYVDQKRLDGATFYRVVPVPGAPDKGIVQGGLHFDPRKLLPPIAHEPTTKTGLAHTDGTISMGRNTPGTAAGDFFIIVGDMPYMDADPSKPGDNAGYAAFGHVVEGMDVVKHMLGAPISPTAGEGAFRGQMIAAPIKILSVRRLGPPDPVAAVTKPKPPAPKTKLKAK